MIQRVYEQALKCTLLDEVIVAADDQRIFDEVTGFEALVMLSRRKHRNGTERCAEVLENFPDHDYVVNIQCDEPFLPPEVIDLFQPLMAQNAELITLATRIHDQKTLTSEHEVKVVINQQQHALYFSRNTIPYAKNDSGFIPLKHLGIYAYRADILPLLSKLPESSLERAEGLEQLRWMDHGYQIKVLVSEYDSKSINNPEDLA